MRSPVFLAALLALAAGLAAPAAAQPPPAACGPNDTSPACQAIRRAAPGGSITGLVAPRPTGPLPVTPRQGRIDLDDAPPRRFIPPQVLALLNDRRVEPLIRAYLVSMAGRPFEEWTLADLQTLSAVVPTLVEVGASTAALRELYEALGLDPDSLFDPQLGAQWQGSSTEFDPRNLRLRRGTCPILSRAARADPASVRVQALLTCAEERR